VRLACGPFGWRELIAREAVIWSSSRPIRVRELSL
jgi:hypothetical protein